MGSPVANCSVVDATATSLIVLISIKLYNLPPTKAVTNENITRAHYQIVSYVNDGCTRHKIPNIMVGNSMNICLNLSQSFKVRN